MTLKKKPGNKNKIVREKRNLKTFEELPLDVQNELNELKEEYGESDFYNYTERRVRHVYTYSGVNAENFGKVYIDSFIRHHYENNIERGEFDA